MGSAYLLKASSSRFLVFIQVLVWMVYKCQLLVLGSDLGVGCCFWYAQVGIVVYGCVHNGGKIDGRWKSQLDRFVGMMGTRMGSEGDMLIV